jgi:hypothetical protein
MTALAAVEEINKNYKMFSDEQLEINISKYLRNCEVKKM